MNCNYEESLRVKFTGAEIAFLRNEFTPRFGTEPQISDGMIMMLAGAPVLSATTLARILEIAVKNAIRLLDELLATGTSIEVTHRSKRRLFGLQGLTPLRHVVWPPYRPDPNRGPGRPRHEIEEDVLDVAPPPLPPLTPIERRSFDYTALEEAIAHLDAVVRRTRHVPMRPSIQIFPSSIPPAGTSSGREACNGADTGSHTKGLQSL
jgi:hypothetical protein